MREEDDWCLVGSSKAFGVYIDNVYHHHVGTTIIVTERDGVSVSIVRSIKSHWLRIS